MSQQLDLVIQEKATAVAELAAAAGAAAEAERQLAAARQQLAVKEQQLQEATDKVGWAGSGLLCALLRWCSAIVQLRAEAVL